jgi:hypothetical protein
MFVPTFIYETARFHRLIQAACPHAFQVTKIDLVWFPAVAALLIRGRMFCFILGRSLEFGDGFVYVPQGIGSVSTYVGGTSCQLSFGIFQGFYGIIQVSCPRQQRRGSCQDHGQSQGENG